MSRRFSGSFSLQRKAKWLILSDSWSHALLSHTGQEGCHTLAFPSPGHTPFARIFFLLKSLLNSGAEKGNLHFNCSLIAMPQQDCDRPNNDPEKDIHILTPEPTNGTL